MNKDLTLIFKCLVGSRAHGLHDEDSDYDYRGVFVLPTKEILDLKNVGGKYKANDWFEGEEDHTAYEIGHFLKLACKCNPSVLECFKGKIPDIIKPTNKEIKILNLRDELLDLFPFVWNPIDAFNAFTGYSKNQQVKMLKDETPKEKVSKYACAYLRTLYNLEQLLKTGNFTLDVTHNQEFFIRLKEIRKGNFKIGDVIEEAKERIEYCKILRDKCAHEPDLDKVNDFLLKVRKEYWNGQKRSSK